MSGPVPSLDAPSPWPPPPPPGVSGGTGDPRSAHAVDVDAVVQAAARYAHLAAGLGDQAEVLRGVAGELMGLTRTDARLAAESVALLAVAGRLRRQVADRVAFAERARIAVMLYEEVDARNAKAFRRLRVDPVGVVGPSPIGLQRRGWCTTAPPQPGEPSGRPPLCPGADRMVRVDPADLYPVQNLVLGPATIVPTTAAPGVAGILQAVHDDYGARTADGAPQDAIDVIRRTYRAPDGSLRESYLVALAGTSRWDLPGDVPDPRRHRTMRPNLEGVEGIPSAEARLVPEALAAAGAPAGAEVLLAGHSQGGMTAMSAAALPAMRRYRVQVLTAGSPVSRAPTVPAVRYLHVENRGDVVPVADGAPNRPTKDQVTVSVGRMRDPLEAHKVERYTDELRRIDEARSAGRLDPRLGEAVDRLESAGHVRNAGDDDAHVTMRFPIGRA